MPDTITLKGFTKQQIEQLKDASDHELAFLNAEKSWIEQARVDQVLPINFTKALLMTGRAWGKTRSAAGWARRMAGLLPGSVGHVVAPTFGDLRGTVFEGVSGLLSVIPPAMIALHNKSHFEIKFVNGTWLRGFSAEEPDRLRGPQCHWLWGDELAHWQYLADMLSNIDFSTRLVFERKDVKGEIVQRIQPQKVYTTTPLPLDIIREMAETVHGPGIKQIWQVRGSLYDNKENLAEGFIEDIVKHEGTKLGDQEIYGKVLDFDESAIIKKRWLKLWPKDRQLPQFEFIYVSFDTAFTEESYDKDKQQADPTACEVFGVFNFEGRMGAMLLNAWDERLGFPDLLERAKEEMRIEYGHMEPVKPTNYREVLEQGGRPPELVRVPKKAALMIVEDKGSGISMRQMLAKEKLPMHAYNPGKASKLERVNSIAHVVKNGRFWLVESQNPDKHGKPKHVDWADAFVAQLCQYTGPGSTKNDDYIDAFSQAMRYFADQYLPGTSSDKKDQRPARARGQQQRAANPYGG